MFATIPSPIIQTTPNDLDDTRAINNQILSDRYHHKDSCRLCPYQ